MENKREGWASRLGFLLASAGSAIGLGNLWGFPYKLGKNGGFAYLIVYIAVVAMVGCVVMLAEFALGRRTGKSPVGAYRALDRRFAFNGWIASLASFIILSFYSVLGAGRSGTFSPICSTAWERPTSEAPAGPSISPPLSAAGAACGIT